MRISRNINQYLDRMQPEDGSRLWRVLTDMEWDVQQTDRYYNGLINTDDPEVKNIVELRKDSLRYAAQKVDKFMQALGKESLFGTEQMSRPMTDENFRSILARYHELMDKTE